MDEELAIAQSTQALSNMPASFPPTLAQVAEADMEIDTPRTKGEKSIYRQFFSSALEFMLIVGIALLGAIIIKNFLMQPFEIPTESMASTLVPGDRILVNKLADNEAEIKRGNIVVFVDPGGWLPPRDTGNISSIRKGLRSMGETVGILPRNSYQHLVKRVIGMPGDRVKCCSASGQITVNGVAINERYLQESMLPSATEFEVEVPAGHIWVMGDNRSNSKDSRFHHADTGFGFVPIKNIEGRVWLKVYPFSRMGRIASADTVFKKVPAPATK